jgi:RNA polymerase sigma factor (sigma-70 family)
MALAGCHTAVAHPAPRTATVGPRTRAQNEALLASVFPLVNRLVADAKVPVSDREDVQQSILMRLWERIGEYNPAAAAFTTWTNIVARSVIADHFDRSDRTVPAGGLPRQDPPAAEGDGDDEPIGPDAGRLLAGVAAPMLGCLSAKERELVAMFAGEKLSVPEVAARLGRKVSLVEIALRAIAGKLIEAGVVPEELAERFARWRAAEEANPARPAKGRGVWRPAAERRAEGGAAVAA